MNISEVLTRGNGEIASPGRFGAVQHGARTVLTALDLLTFGLHLGQIEPAYLIRGVIGGEGDCCGKAGTAAAPQTNKFSP